MINWVFFFFFLVNKVALLLINKVSVVVLSFSATCSLSHSLHLRALKKCEFQTEGSAEISGAAGLNEVRLNHKPMHKNRNRKRREEELRHRL